MVATPVKTAPRLTTQIDVIAPDTTTIRSLDWDRDRFDIEFGLQNGTTYNSYVIESEKNALVDTSHLKFKQLYFDALNQVIDPSKLDYLIISHTEPDHSGLVKDLLAIAPEITIVASKVAIQFLEGFIHQDFNKQIVKNGDQIDLGNGHIIEFINAPNLHWPDTIFSYDHGTQALFTCDAFGLHYCSADIYDKNLTDIEADYRFYYDCLMGPNARSVLSAMKRMSALGEISLVANGHGPILKYNYQELLNRYQTWSKEQTKGNKIIIVFYVSDYGYSDRLSQAIAKGVTKTGVEVEMIDINATDIHEITAITSSAAGIILGMPPLSNNDNNQMSNKIGTILASVKSKQTFGLYESYGGDDEPIDPIASKLRNLGLNEAFAPIKIKETPHSNTYQICEESGVDLGQIFSQKTKIKKVKSVDNDLSKAMGRLSGGLYIITASKSETKGAMLASWVSQASFSPPGFTVAVAKDRAIESLMQVHDTFVLNILEEGNYQGLMKHFLKRFPPGADRFEGVKTKTANNQSPILIDALAYLECTVVSRMDCGDHWIVYSQVTDGRVSKPDNITAVHHRKVGSYY